MSWQIGASPAGNVGTHYGDVSIVTDVSDLIYQITPEDTPYFHLTGDRAAGASAPWHEWQTRELITRGHNAQFEGFTYAFTGLRLPARRGNVLQILAEDIRVSNSNQAAGHYGIENLRADQIEVKLTELKTSIERAMLRGTLNTGASGVARQMLGIIPMAMTHLSMYTNCTAATFSEVRFNGMLEQGWSAGAALRDCLVDGRMKRVISNFTGGQVRYIDAAAAKSILSIDMIETEYGPVNIHLCRDMADFTFSSGVSLGRGVLFIDKTHHNKAWLRPVSVQAAAKIADSDDYIATAELTSEYGHPMSTALYANTVSPI